ncbi:helix-turn-helix domain-containing protein [Mucilaginibacter pedocola]|uniref:HTH cro/C1-type domain-containing protein n=1 Tax=Mucilaginibacter pedocola TaxID=1792845 RepID=A0A1S9PH20_9SPHI|nr:helix-turn-helix transcriptional regulator [Mucilaginibacter pedocola]OOQ59848.1 hypothetical protein BC343_06805 [Mucilaginibacter pedocola]
MGGKKQRTLSINAFVGQNIRPLRKDKRLSLKAVAEKLDVSSASLSKIENGLTDINFSRLGQIAEAFEVDVLSLVSNEVIPPRPGEAHIERGRQRLDARDREILELQRKAIFLLEEVLAQKDKPNSTKN